MLIRNPKRWMIAERDATPESVYFNRRAFLSAGAGLIGAGMAAPAFARTDAEAPIAPELYPAPKNDAYTIQRELTKERLALTYNNFYEFGSHKEISSRAQDLPLRPWTVKIDGMVGKPMELDAEELIRKMPIEERLYRHRCVETWSMTVPWSGFALAELVKMAEPQAGAKYIRMETFMMPDVARGQRQRWYPWPYVEGLTIEEATNDLAFMATGVYGKPIAKQMGAPLRLAVPWKYGFKSIKSIVRFEFTDKRPKSFWEILIPKEYGFFANVNPEVPHRRWSQAEEKPLGWSKKIPTLLYNGYAEEVANLYAGMDPKKIFY